MKYILKALIKEEARDYDPPKDKYWVSKALETLKKKINNIDGSKYSYVRISNRCGPDGYSRIVELALPQAKWDDKGTFHIKICDCGRLNHLFICNY